MAAPSGWYDDGSGRQRWWDGTQWTDNYQEGAQSNVATQTLEDAGQPFGGPPPQPKATKPWFMRWWVWLIAALFLIGIISNLASGGNRDATPEATTDVAPVPTQTSPPEEEETSPPEAPARSEVPTDAEVVEIFTAYLDERAASDVMIAQAVSGVQFSEGEVLVTFDPAGKGVSPDVFGELNPFDNMAEFAGIPVAFADEDGRWLRQVVTSVRTQFADGTDLGSRTVGELYKMGTGEEWAPGL